jgi:hypothetical protein
MQLLVPLLNELAFDAWPVSFLYAMVSHYVQDTMSD